MKVDGSERGISTAVGIEPVVMLGVEESLPPFVMGDGGTLALPGERESEGGVGAGFGGSAVTSIGELASSTDRFARLSASHVSHCHSSSCVRPYTRRRETGQ